MAGGATTPPPPALPPQMGPASGRPEESEARAKMPSLRSIEEPPIYHPFDTRDTVQRAHPDVPRALVLIIKSGFTCTSPLQRKRGLAGVKSQVGVRKILYIHGHVFARRLWAQAAADGWLGGRADGLMDTWVKGRGGVRCVD